MRTKRAIWIGILAVAFGACAHGGRRAGPEVGRPPPGREIAVENWTGADLQVFAYYGGDVRLLGRVRPMGTLLTRLPDAAGGEIRLLTQPIGIWETQHVSEPVHVSFGERVTWQLRATGGSTISDRALLRPEAEEGLGHRRD